MHTELPSIKKRMRRSKGRLGRDCMANARVTKGEQVEIENAAEKEGKSLSEWAREVLLREARSRVSDRALFTEVVAVRLLLLNSLKPLVTGLQMSEDEFAKLTAEIRSSKHAVARDLLESYTNPLGGK